MQRARSSFACHTFHRRTSNPLKEAKSVNEKDTRA